MASRQILCPAKKWHSPSGLLHGRGKQSAQEVSHPEVRPATVEERLDLDIWATPSMKIEVSLQGQRG